MQNEDSEGMWRKEKYIVHGRGVLSTPCTLHGLHSILFGNLMRYFKSSKFVLLPQKYDLFISAWTSSCFPWSLCPCGKVSSQGACWGFMAVSAPAVGTGTYAVLTRAETAEGLCCSQGQYLQVKRKPTVNWIPDNLEPWGRPEPREASRGFCNHSSQLEDGANCGQTQVPLP